MDQPEFYDVYRQYSTADLINIVREKDNYQPAAVLAAERLLQEEKSLLLIRRRLINISRKRR